MNKRVSLRILCAIARVSGHEMKREVVGQRRMNTTVRHRRGKVIDEKNHEELIEQ